MYRPRRCFYIFANVKTDRQNLGRERIKNDKDVAKFFLNVAHVAVVPGVAFGYEGYVRFFCEVSRHH